jgi:thioredoxin 1
MDMETAQKQKTFSEVINTETLVFVDFFTEWCGPCKMMKPILKELKTMVGDKVKILKVDVDKNPLVGDTYQIRSVPTLGLFKDGKMVWRQSGVMSARHLAQIIQQYQ